MGSHYKNWTIRSSVLWVVKNGEGMSQESMTRESLEETMPSTKYLSTKIKLFCVHLLQFSNCCVRQFGNKLRLAHYGPQGKSGPWPVFVMAHEQHLKMSVKKEAYVQKSFVALGA